MKKVLMVIALVELFLFTITGLLLNNKKSELIAYHEPTIVNNKQDIINNIYDSLNHDKDVRITCNKEYGCSKDIIDILNDSLLMMEINNLVDPLRSYSSYKLEYNGDYIIKFNRLYSDDDITILNKATDIIINDLISDEMTTSQKLIVIHNYLINNIKYQKDGGNKATDALLNGKAICTGYADLLAIFLNKLNIPNYKVVNDNHVWNVVYVNDEWKHIDLTYDDPINETNNISYNYFLINTDTLNNYHDNNHYFDKSIYVEL